MNVSDYFQQTFGYNPSITQFTPGRVNLIGEHIDYNGGTVLPMAINKGVHIALATRTDDKINIASDRFDQMASGSLHGGLTTPHWAKYAFYAGKRAVRLGWINNGMDITLTSNLVDGAGLSSSAAVIVGVLKALRAISKTDINDVELAVLARKIENEDLGVPCGIMDQMAVSVAKPQQAMTLDTQNLAYKVINLADGYVFPVVHSGARRSLTDGMYKIRKEECDSAKAKLGTNDICKLDLIEVEAVSMDAHIFRRVRHCITEHRRVLDAAHAMQTNNIEAFANLINQSHASMRDDFEMSIPAIDELVDISRKHGALGARLTGGGFGGCIVSCVPGEKVEAWATAIQADAPNSFRVV